MATMGSAKAGQPATAQNEDDSDDDDDGPPPLEDVAQGN